MTYNTEIALNMVVSNGNKTNKRNDFGGENEQEDIRFKAGARLRAGSELNWSSDCGSEGRFISKELV